MRKVLLLAPCPLASLPSPHLSEPREPVILKRPPPPVVPGRLAQRLPAGDSSPAPGGDGASPASTSGTSGSQTGFRVKRWFHGSSTRKNSCLLSLHLHPSSSLAAHSRSLTPRDLGHPGTNFSANFATGADGCFCFLRGSVKLCGVESPRRGFLCLSLCESPRGAGVRAAQAWAPRALCVAFRLQTWV